MSTGNHGNNHYRIHQTTNLNDIDNAISLLTKTITNYANRNLGIVKDSKHSKNWWTK